MTTMKMNQARNIFQQRMFRVKDPISALTHLFGAIGALIGLPVLLLHGVRLNNPFPALVSYVVFMMSMILLYSASTVYHSFSISYRVNLILKKIDHMMIFILIAGTYTPVAVTAVPWETGKVMLIAVWSIALIGIIFKAFWVTCPKWVSSVIYVAMGWVCVFFMKDIVAALSPAAFAWVLAGGLFYTVGAVIYALKPKMFETKIKGFGNHELFHCFVLAGSLCHFIFVYHFLTLLA